MRLYFATLTCAFLVCASAAFRIGTVTGYKSGYKDGSTNSIDYCVSIQLNLPNGTISTTYITNLTIPLGTRHVTLESP